MQTSTGETPFTMTYGVEAMVAVEVGVPSHKRKFYDQDTNHELMCGELDLLEETRAQVQLRVTSYQQRLAWFFNSKVKKRRLKVWDLVLRRVMQNTKEVNTGVLGLNWEGPYNVIEIVRPRAYRLQKLDHTLVPRAWNTKHLRLYYQWWGRDSEHVV